MNDRPIPTPSQLRYRYGEGLPQADWRSMPEGREKYAAYLCSREWAEKRRAVLERCGGVCERCRINDVDAVHHLTYARKYDERLDDLAGWCKGCHDFTHGHSDEDPAKPKVDWRGPRPLLESIVPQPEDVTDGKASVLICPVCLEFGNHVTRVDYVDGKTKLTICGECGHKWELFIWSRGGRLCAATANHTSEYDEAHHA